MRLFPVAKKEERMEDNEALTPGFADAPGADVTPAHLQESNPEAAQAHDPVPDGQEPCAEDVAAEVSPNGKGDKPSSEPRSSDANAEVLRSSSSAGEARETATAPRKGTGPRTEPGKRRSSRNALKLGIFAKVLLLDADSAAEFDALRDGLRKDLRPQGTLECVLVEKLAVLLWRLRRLIRYNSQKMLNDSSGALVRYESTTVEQVYYRGPSGTTTTRDGLDFLIRYESTLERSIDRTLVQLERLQKARRG
jgi:hypothetical protein